MNAATVDRIKEVRRKSTVSFSEAHRITSVQSDCYALSSGTLSTLTGLSDYCDLDVIHNDFALFVDALAPSRRWGTWHDAWSAFVTASGLQRKAR